MKIDFTDKKVLVTGGTRGIGREIANAYVALGAKVVVTGKNLKRVENLPKSVLYEHLEIDEKNDWRKRVAEIVEDHEGFDICINNAGINKISKIDELDAASLDAILLTNLNAPIYIAAAVAKKMVANKAGFIVNIASIFGVVSKEGRDVYTASKSGLIGVTKSMAIDLAKYNILVNAISPGFVDTELTRTVLGTEGIKAMKARIPMQKLAQTTDIIPAILFVTSQYNTYITGQNIIIDGGFTLE
ncbi:SDR family oxidoreductase [bacterium]|nr:SDR family oxidoreductase [bacterium]MBU1433505.1 SDR family oxidoreductase [bacterium]MBU1503313.1 SDR family oxidoreductase [bacterium]